MRLSYLVLLISMGTASIAHAQRFQCMNNSQGTRNVSIVGKSMTVVNPKTPNIVFSKPATSETRGNITKTTSDSWELIVKDGMGNLTNLTFGETYGCVQTGS